MLAVLLSLQPVIQTGDLAWLKLWPLLSLFLVLYALAGLYPGVSVGPVEEIRRVFTACFGAFVFIALDLNLEGAPIRVHPWWLIACICIAAGTAVTRSAIRGAGARFQWWGYPTAIIGGGEAALTILRKLMEHPRMGLRPVALVTDHLMESPADGVTVVHYEHLHHVLNCGVKHAVVAAPELSEAEFAAVLERGGDGFPHMIIIPDTHFIWKSGSHTRDLMGMLGLQVGNNLLRTVPRVAKRVIDLGLCLLFAPLLLVLMTVIAALVAIESGFPVLYSQNRIGYKGREFRIWKFRTMVPDATQVLEHALARDAELRRDWTENQKLRNDPRVTRIGRVLRRSSLDELPQLWNVIRGEMSLVGPRPIVRNEIVRYKEAYSRYAKTVPGVTGLWQVSGRSRTTYAERVAYDAYYVRNWSVWLDIYLLARTIGVIFTGDGAY
jgi:Undecaprenyl-phosphate galactose phosphotransferase WbaP